MMVVYERRTYVQLAFQEKGSHAKVSSPQQTHDKRRRKQMWKGGGTTSAKGVHGGEN